MSVDAPIVLEARGITRGFSPGPRPRTLPRRRTCPDAPLTATCPIGQPAAALPPREYLMFHHGGNGTGGWKSLRWR